MTATRIPSEVIEVPDFVTMTEPGQASRWRSWPSPWWPCSPRTRPCRSRGYLSLSTACQEIDMQFGTEPDTFHVLARWAERFGGTVTGSRTEDVHGEPSVRCEVSSRMRGCR